MLQKSVKFMDIFGVDQIVCKCNEFRSLRVERVTVLREGMVVLTLMYERKIDTEEEGEI